MPPRVQQVDLQFPREGIDYDSLSDEEQEQWESLDWGDDVDENSLPDKVNAAAINSWLFNKDTVDKVLQHLMEHGHTVEGGDRLAKTILFARNHTHAQFIEERFNHHYPRHTGHFARIIDHYATYPQRLLDDFSQKDSAPQATSTVMLLGAVTPLVSGIAAGVVLVVIDPVLTTLLAVAAIFWSLLLYPLTRQQVRIAGRTARGKAAFARESRELIDSPDEIGSDGNLGSAATLAAVVIGRRRIANRIKLVLQIGVATIGTVAAVYLAYRIMGGIGDWPIFIVYLGGLRIALNGCFAVPRTIGMVTRHYPRVVVYIEFLQDAAAIDAGGLGHIGPGDVATLGSLSDGTPVCARAGDLVAVAALEGASAVQAAFLGARAAATGLPLAATWVEVAAPPRQVSANDPIRLTEAQPIAEMDRPEVHAFVDSLKDGVTAIVYRDEARIGAFGETHLIVVDAGQLTTSVPLGTAESRAALESFADRRAPPATGPARSGMHAAYGAPRRHTMPSAQAVGKRGGGAGRTSVSQSSSLTGHFVRLHLRLWLPRQWAQSANSLGKWHARQDSNLRPSA